MIIDCISDLHGNYPNLEGGDLLIIAGDLTTSDTEDQYIDFWRWTCYQNYKKVIVIAGNHDNYLENFPGTLKDGGDHLEYLCDSATEFEGLSIWGSPWTLTFPGINPHCTAFTGTEAELEAKFALIPNDVHILITHGPPYSILDQTIRGENVGSRSLFQEFYSERIKPKLHIFGHIHESYGHIPKFMDAPGVQFVNCSHVNEHYKPVNKPIRIEV